MNCFISANFTGLIRVLLANGFNVLEGSSLDLNTPVQIESASPIYISNGAILFHMAGYMTEINSIEIFNCESTNGVPLPEIPQFKPVNIES